MISDNFAYFFIKTYVVEAHWNSNELDSNEHPQHRFL